MQKDMNLLFLNIFLTLLTILILSGLFIYVLSKKSIVGALPFCVFLSFLLLYSFASFLELLSTNYTSLVFWRNVAQIGNFFGSVTSLYFSLTFVGLRKRRNLITFLFSLVPIIFIILIFSPYEYLVRSSVEVMEKGSYPPLVITSTSFGKLFVAYNFIPILTSILILFSFRGPKTFRIQAKLIALGFMLSTIMFWLKAAGLPIPIEMNVFYMLGALIILYGLFRYNLLSLSPIARDKVFEVLKEGVIVFSLQRIVDLNPASYDFFQEILKRRDREDLEERGAPTKKVRHESFYIEVLNLIRDQFPLWAQAIEEKRIVTQEIEVPHEDEKKHYSVTTYPLLMKNLHLIGSVSIIRDITHEKKERMLLVDEAKTDGLTGLFNHSFFKESLRAELERCKKYNNSLALIMFDIDHFKTINDSFGHTLGDEVLVRVAEEMHQSFRSTDILGRYGGDEFSILLPDTRIEVALDIAKRLKTKLSSLSFQNNGERFSLTVSIGIAVYPLEESDVDMVVAADKALYKSKKMGRDTITVYQKGM